MKNTTVAAEVYKILPTVLKETSETTFGDLLTKMLSHLQATEKTQHSEHTLFQTGYQRVATRVGFVL